MKPKGSESLFYGVIYSVTAIAIISSVVFYSGLALQNWSIVVPLAVLMLYLKLIVVRIGERIDHSLGTAAIIPIIYLGGTTPAMIIAALSGLADGIYHKKEWRRTLFNASQFAICALLGSLAYQYFDRLIGPVGLGNVVAMGIGMLAYIITNILLVSLLVAIWRGVSWLEQIRLLSWRGIYGSFSNGFVGIIFAFFVMSYGFWGIIGFGALLINLSELLKSAAEVAAERVRRRKLEEELIIDELTGALNFRFLNQWLSEPGEGNAAVLFFDIDDFSAINDESGHAEGDKILKKFVETIYQNIRSDDKVIRYGGDEFVVLLNGMDGKGAQLVAERIITNLRLVNISSGETPVTASVGIAIGPTDARDKHQLLLFADQAMYGAKHAGKNTIRMWSAIKDSA